MLIMRSNILIEGLSAAITQINSCKILSSIDMLTDTCEIVLDNKQSRRNGTIKVGSKITVSIGYEGKTKQEFLGFVDKVGNANPVVIECEDYSWQLKQVNINKSWDKCSLKEIVEYCVAEVNTKGHNISMEGELPDIEMTEGYRIANVNVLQVFDKLKEEYGVYFYFVPGTDVLYAGLAYGALRGEVNYNLEKNVVKPDLEFVSADDVKIKIKVVGIGRDNSNVTVETGNAEGEQRTIFIYGVLDKTVLEERANEEIKKYIYNGYKGTITAWMVPHVTHGMVANVTDPKFEQGNGRYYIDAVTSTFSQSGARNQVSLIFKV